MALSTVIVAIDAQINEMTNNLDLTVVHCLSRENDAQRYFQPHYARVRYEKVM